MGILIIYLLLVLSLSLQSPAPYIHAQDRPLNIAHRGLSSLFPENTLQAFQTALYQGADFIQLDIVFTKQKYPLVMHDPFLTRLTQIKNRTQFADRKETRFFELQQKSDWWTDNFTLAELQSLGIRQDQYPTRNKIFDFKFTFPTLDDVIQMVINFNKLHKGKRNPDGRLGGILIQAKNGQMYRNMYGVQIAQTILQTLKKYDIDTIDKSATICPIYLHSFDFQSVKYWSKRTQLPINYLIFEIQPFNLTEIDKYATGVGFEDHVIWNYENKQPFEVLQKAKSLGLIVHVWTFKDQKPIFNSSTNIKAYEIAQNQLKLDGVITEFADIFSPVSQILRSTANKNKIKQI